MNWYAGPWVWDAATFGGHWRAPAGLSALDLRPLPQQSVRGGTPGLGLFFGNVAPAQLENRSDYASLGSGSWYDLKPTAKQRAAIPVRKGYTPKGDDLVGVILDVLTDGADPDGLDGPKPLQPTADGKLSLHCGQSHHERFRWGNFHTSVLRQALRKDFAAAWQRDPTRARKFLDDLCIKYAVDDWKEFVPPALQADVPGRLPRETTITESFDTANSSTLGPNLSWTEYSDSSGGDRWAVVSNVARVSPKSDGQEAFARADSDLSSADHYAQVNVLTMGSGSENRQIGAFARFNSSTPEGYIARAVRAGLDQLRLEKRVGGTYTNLAVAGISIAPPYTVKCEASGSSIAGYRAGVQVIAPVTDTSITGNTRCGIQGFSESGGGEAELDSFEAADLGGGGGGIVYTQLERGTRGYARGTFEGGL